MTDPNFHVPEGSKDLNKTEFAVLIGLARAKWAYLLRHEGDNKIVEATKGGDNLTIWITGMKTRADLNGENITQKKIRAIIEGRA